MSSILFTCVHHAGVAKVDGAKVEAMAPVPKGTGCPNGVSWRQVALRPVDLARL